MKEGQRLYVIFLGASARGGSSYHDDDVYRRKRQDDIQVGADRLEMYNPVLMAWSLRAAAQGY